MGIKDLARALLPRGLHPNALARARIVRRSRGKVLAGPFAGMTYITGPEDFIEPGMLMGTYERELHPAIEQWIMVPPKLLIDVGASQGYYSVGFARRMPRARHVAFEHYQPRISQLARTAQANGVNVEVQGGCSPEKLRAALQLDDDVCVLVDVDGYELELLDPSNVRELRRSRIIIETHDHLVPGTTDELVRRFSISHRIELLQSVPRTAADLPFKICDRWTVGQINEGRVAPQKWLVLVPVQLSRSTGSHEAETI